MVYIIIFLILIAVLNVAATVKLMRSKAILKEQKVLHGWLIWLVPFIWSVVVVLAYSAKAPKKPIRDGYTYGESGYPMP
jgi:hypothetical protein